MTTVTIINRPTVVRINKEGVQGPVGPGIEEAPNDGFPYARQNGQWVRITADPMTPEEPEPTGEAPVNTAAPIVTGTAEAGSVLSVTDGTWSGSPTPELTYQWMVNDTPLSEATGTTYTTQVNQVGQNVWCRVTATNASGTATADSNAVTVTGPTPEEEAPIFVGGPYISGELVEGSTLTAHPSDWIGYPTPTITYQWHYLVTPIPGATESTYTLTEADIGKRMVCHITATNRNGSDTVKVYTGQDVQAAP